MPKKFNDQQWVNLGGTIQILKMQQPLSGKLIRLLGVVVDKVAVLSEQFDKEFAEELEKAGNPLPKSKEWLDANIAVSDSFKLSETELDIPEFKAEWFDDVKFSPGQYEILTPLFT